MTFNLKGGTKLRTKKELEELLDHMIQEEYELCIIISDAIKNYETYKKELQL